MRTTLDIDDDVLQEVECRAPSPAAGGRTQGGMVTNGHIDRLRDSDVC